MIEICSGYISASDHRIFKNIVSTPHNLPLIIWSRDKNFEESISLISQRDIYFETPCMLIQCKELGVGSVDMLLQY